PTADQLRSGLEVWLQSPERRPDDIVVIYYAGHGVKANLRHYLMCRGSDEGLLVSTAIRADDLALMFANRPDEAQTLIILDTCYAGAGTGDMAVIASQLAAVRPPTANGLWLLAGARGRDIAVEHAFVDGLSTVMGTVTSGAHQQFVDLLEITSRLNVHLRERHPYQHASCTIIDTAGISPFFPNPDFVPDLPPGELDVETLRRMRRQRAGHFDPRGRGVEYPSESGSHFTGRTAALTALARWLASPSHDRRARVVTGDPGSGKSAVLGRLLHLADPQNGPIDALPGTAPPP